MVEKKKFKMPPSCKLKLKEAPTRCCHMAKRRMEKQRTGCEWYINDKKAKYCFWYYLFLKENEPHSITSISRLWGTSINNVSIADRSAKAKFRKSVK